MQVPCHGSGLVPNNPQKRRNALPASYLRMWKDLLVKVTELGVRPEAHIISRRPIEAFRR